MDSGHEFEPRILGFLCNWCCYAGADLAGVSRFQYPPNMRVIRLMCSGRVDPAYIFRAFSTGQDAVFIGGCHLNDCHYVTHGNYDALGLVYVCKKVMKHIGLHPERLRLEWVSAGEGIRFAKIMNDFDPQIKKMGPLGKGEGEDARDLDIKLERVANLIPYMKMVLSEKFAVSERSEEAYSEFFTSEEFNRLFKALIGDKLDLALPVSPSKQKAGIGAGESEKIDRMIEKYTGKSNSLIQVLLEIQHENKCLSHEILDRISHRLEVPVSRIRQIVTFHHTFRLIPGEGEKVEEQLE